MCYEEYWRLEEARRAREAEDKRRQPKEQAPAKPAPADKPVEQPDPVPV
ncbi:MAG TPA: hypothetical protein VFR66_02200 [Burkholderiales bacterium]|nr:hypothetical protein [Burkholderiales bacterium]